MKRNIYHPAIGCSCGLHTWPTLLQSVCKTHYCVFGRYFVRSHVRVFAFNAVHLHVCLKILIKYRLLVIVRGLLLFFVLR